MRIGIFIGVVGSAPDFKGLVQQAVEVEDEGFDSFWTPQTNASDALTLLALAGQRTERIELGTAVVPTYPRHPMMLAQQGLTVQAATGGRLALGIGLSHKATVEARFGIPYERPAQHMREYLSVLRALVHEGSVDFRGRFFTSSGEVRVPDSSPFPILVAALGPVMLRVAGELADGTVTWMVGPKTLRMHIVPRITEAAAGAGRPSPRVCVGVSVAVTDNVAAARERAAGYFGSYERQPSYRSMLDMEGVQGPADVTIIGSEAEVEEELRALAAAGATDLLAVAFPDSDAEKGVGRSDQRAAPLVGR